MPTKTGPLAQRAAVEAFTAWLKVDTEHYPQEDRRLDISYERAPVLRSDIEALLAAIQSLAQIASNRTGELSEAREGINAQANRASRAEAQRDTWCSAFEALHARILRDLPGDGSEVPQPDDEYWARVLDELVAFAAETAHAAEGGE